MTRYGYRTTVTEEPDALLGLVEAALLRRDDLELRWYLVEHSGLPGPRMNLDLVAELARLVGAIVVRPDPPGDELAALLDGWAALTVDEAPGDRPEVILPCAAVLAYGAVGAARTEWWNHELGKVRRAASDPRWRVRETVAMALQRFLAADWSRALGSLRGWAGDDDPLVVRAAVAAVAEPPLLDDAGHAADALAIQRLGIASLASRPPAERRSEDVRVLRQGLAYTVSVAVAATGDFGPLDDMARSGDPDLVWAAKQNLTKARLRSWPDELAAVRAALES